MKRSIVPAVLVCLFAWTGALPAQQAVTIKLKTRGAGETILVGKEEKMSMSMKITDGTGKVLVNKDMAATSISEYVETVINREGKKRPTLLEREYIKMIAKSEGKTEDSPLQGKKVVIEKKGTNYTFTYKGGDTVPGAAAAALAKEFSRMTEDRPEMEDLVLPKTPVKPGDSWNLDMGPIVKDLAENATLDADTAKATGTGTLQKVYQKDGKQYGEMKFKLDLPVKAMGQAPGKMQFADGGKAAVEILLDTCIDGTSELGTMNTKMHSAATPPWLNCRPVPA